MADPNRVGGTKRKAPVSFDVRNTLSYAPTPRTLLLNCHSKPRMRAGFFEIVLVHVYGRVYVRVLMCAYAPSQYELITSRTAFTAKNASW